MKYRYKPNEIEAIQYNGNNRDEISKFTNGDVLSGSVFQCAIGLIICKNYWIIKENNKFLLCTPELFEMLYEKIK